MSNPDGPVTANFFHRRADTSLDILVVGGSIDGLAAAYNLKQAGHSVRIFEKLGTRGGSRASNLQHRAKGCMRSPPNMVKCLQQWGLKPRLDCGIPVTKIQFLDASTGRYESCLIWHQELLKELGAEFLNMHYDDLYEMMYDLTTQAGVDVQFGSEAVDLDVDAPAVTLADGRRIAADFIVGADGPFGLTREKVVGHKEEPEIGPYATYSFTVSVDDMLADPKLAPLVGNGGMWTIWTGDTYNVLVYKIRKSECVVHYSGPPIKGIERGKPVPLSKMDIGQFEETVHRLFAIGATDAREELHPVQQALENWFSDNGKVVLVGDTVHAPCPSSSNSHALAIEDGATLGCLFSRLQSRNSEEMLRLLSAYQEIRQERCEVTVKSDADLMTFTTLPPGPARDARTEGFRLTREKMDLLDWTNISEDLLRDSWEEFRFSFAYDAYDAADEWWVNWGLTYERMNAAQGKSGMRSGSALSTFATEGEDDSNSTGRGVLQPSGGLPSLEGQTATMIEI